MRTTIQYSLVLDAVRKLHCHATAEEIYEEVLKVYPNISRGTVYRNLNRLCEMGKIRKRELPGGADGYDHCCKDHYHARCIECGRLFDVDLPYLPHLETQIKETHGFLYTGYDIIFHGICPDCQKKHGDRPEKNL